MAFQSLINRVFLCGRALNLYIFEVNPVIICILRGNLSGLRKKKNLLHQSGSLSQRVSRFDQTRRASHEDEFMHSNCSKKLSTV
jgi:hypothetical protein